MGFAGRTDFKDDLPRLRAHFETSRALVEGARAAQHAQAMLRLALVRRIVVLHDGSIDVFCEGAGRGTAFTVSLPLAPRAAAGPR